MIKNSFKKYKINEQRKVNANFRVWFAYPICTEVNVGAFKDSNMRCYNFYRTGIGISDCIETLEYE